MNEIFISYARSTEPQAQRIAEALRALGYGVWRDDELPAHRAYTEVIEERLKAAKAVVVVWSAEAAKSEWVQSEADRARSDRKLVQLTVDGAALPMPFDRIQCADLVNWAGDIDHPGWRKVAASVAELAGGTVLADRPAAAAPPPMPTKPSIAVMPLANLSGDADQDYFADGMMEEIVNALSRFKSIFVIASGSTMTFKGKATPPAEVSRQLGVRYLLEGSVRRSVGRVRIAVRLIEAADGAQIWGDHFDDTLEDVFALQDRIALAVAGVIEPAVEAAEIRRALRRPTENLDALDLTLRGISLLRTFSREGVGQALDVFERAVGLDPGYALPLACSAQCLALGVINGWSPAPRADRLRSLDLAGRALRQAADDAFILFVVGETQALHGENLENALALADRARQLNPGMSAAWFSSGWMRAVIGEVETSEQHLTMSMRLDPLSPNRAFQLSWLGVVRFAQGRIPEALALFKESAQLAPAYPINHGMLPACYGQLGQMADARQSIKNREGLTLPGFAAFAQWAFRDPDHRQLYLDGIALAEGGG